mgnify:CR=1 FL=1
MTENSSKIYPASSDSVAQMLGLKTRSEESEEDFGTQAEENEIAPADLPVPDLPTAKVKSANGSPWTNHAPRADIDVEMEEINGKPSAVKRIFKAALPYLVVFAIGLTAYYFFLADTSFNFSGIFKAKSKPAALPLTVKNSKLSELQKSSTAMENYRKWIIQFYFSKSIIK